MSRRTLAALAFAGLALAGLAAARAGQAPPARRWLLREPFAGTRLDRARWGTCHWWGAGGCTIATNHELEWYRPGQVRVRGGALRLTAARRAVRGSDGRRYAYVSGMVSSGPPGERGRPRFAFRYGRVEIRARVPAGRGLWSAFWLLPASRRSRPEIDVMEIVGQRPRTVAMHLHTAGPGGRRDLGRDYRAPRSLAAGWHRFAVDWRPRRLRWLIDGVERFRVSGRAVPSEPMYLVADLAVGGDSPGRPGRATRFPSTFAIDSVRVSR